MPFIIPATSIGALTSLTQIRQYVAVELGGEGIGGFMASLATGGSGNQLIDANWPANTNLDVAEQWQDAWLLRPNPTFAADKLRLVSSYTPSGGIFVPDLSWTGAPAAGELYEIHTVLEPITAMIRCINNGLMRCMVETEFAFTPIGGAQWHSMAQVAPWLTNQSWVRQVGWLSSSENRNRVWPYERVVRGEAVEESGTVVLSHPDHVFGGSGQTNPYTIYVRAMIPAYYLCMSPNTVIGTASAITTDGTTWTITVPSTANMVVGQLATLAGFTPTTWNLTAPVMAVPNSTQFQIESILQPTGPTIFGSVTSASSRSGLSAETDYSPARMEWAAWAAIVEAWRHYGQALDTSARTRLIPNRTEAADMFTKWTRDCSKWPRLTFRPLLAGGPRSGFGGMPNAYRASTA